MYVETHHGYGPNTWRRIGVAGPVPDTFRKLGTIEPTEEERTGYPPIGTVWINLARERFTQWRWDHDRAALLQEEQAAEEQKARDEVERARQRQEYLDALTLPALRKKRRFSEWKGDRPDPAIAACRQAFRKLIDGLIALGPSPTKPDVSALVCACVETLNALDERHDGFIETGEREALCSEINEIVYAAGLRNCDGLADEWREW